MCNLCLTVTSAGRGAGPCEGSETTPMKCVLHLSKRETADAEIRQEAQQGVAGVLRDSRQATTDSRVPAWCF